MVHSLCALSTLRRSGLRTASAAAKPSQGDSSEFYLITGIPDDLQHSFRISDVYYHDPEMCEHACLMVTILHGGNNTTKMINRFIVADDLKESSKITQVKGTKFKDHYIMYKELLEYVIGTCPKDFNQRDKKHAYTPFTKKKQVTFEVQCATSNSNTHKHVEQLNTQKTNVHVPPSTGVNGCIDASGSQPRSNTKKNRILPAKSVNKKNVEEHPRTNKSNLKTKNRFDSSISSKRTVINSNSHTACKTCNKCLISANHDMYVVTYLHSVNASPSVKNVVRKVKQVWKPKQVKQVWKPTGKILPTVGCSKHMMGDRSRLRNFMKKFIGTVRFGNDHFGAIMGYGDYVIVTFRKHSCYVRDMDGVGLIKVSHGSNLYTISVKDMMKSSPICMLSKASKNKSWLWHRRLNHLNFGTINDLARKDLVRGLPRLKFEKDHLCSACQLGKIKKHTHKPKIKNTNLEVLNTLHMDLYGPMRVQTINEKKYILVIVDDYSRFTWVKFLRSKDETAEVVIKFLKQIQVGLNKTIRYICTDNGTEFINKDLTAYYKRVGIDSSKDSTAERRNRSCGKRGLMDTRIYRVLGGSEKVYNKEICDCMIINCRQLTVPNYSAQHIGVSKEKRKEETVLFEDLGKLQPTTDIGIFVGYTPSRKVYRIYNKRTRQIMEIIHVQFDELTEQMAPMQLSTGPTPTFFTPEPPRVKRPVSPAQAVPILVNSAGTPSSTTIDQDAPSPSYSPSSLALQSPSIHQGIAAESTLVEENMFTPVDNDPFINIFAPEPTSEASSSGDVSSAESTYVTQTLHHLKK
ncbi:retrovirus-related pol polyprotein from transposon TNT 1-94 [Tanacetum coccineum]